MNKPIRISVVIPVRIGGSAKIALAALAKTAYPQSLIEVFVVEGNQPAKQRNKAISETNGEVVYFLDDDSEIDKNLFSRIVEIYGKDSQVAAIVGPMVIDGFKRSFWPQVFRSILTSFFGVLKKRARYSPVGSLRQASDDDIILSNFSVRKEVCVQENGFNEQLYPNEENELFQRFKRKGYKSLYSPEAPVYRRTRKSPSEFLRSIFNYGRGRAKQAFLCPDLRSRLHFLTLAFPVYLAILPFSRQWIFFLPLFAYISAAILVSLKIAWEEKSPALMLALPFSFFLTHLAYPLGLAWGVAARVLGIGKIQPFEIRVSKIKSFNSDFDNEQGRLYLDFYGIGLEITSSDEDCLLEITRDFSYFQAAELKQIDVRIAVFNQSPPYQAIPALKASLYMPEFLAYDDNHKRYVDYNGRALTIYDYKIESGGVYSSDKNLLHEIAYLLVLSRLGELLDKMGVHRLHGLGFTFNRKPVLCLLPSNGGKTALALDLLTDERVKLISEDTPLVTRDGRILPFPIRLGTQDPPPANIPGRYLRSFQRRKYGVKTLIDTDFFKAKLVSGRLPAKMILIGERNFSDSAGLIKINKLKAMGPLSRNLILGLGLPQLVEYFLRHDLFDIIRKTGIVLSRAYSSFVLLGRAEVYRFSLGRQRVKNREVLLGFLTEKLEAFYPAAEEVF